MHAHTCLSAGSESQVLWEASLPASKKLNSQMVHPALLEGVGRRAGVLCNWYGFLQRTQMGFLCLNSPVSAGSQKLRLGCSQPGQTLFGCNYWVKERVSPRKTSWTALAWQKFQSGQFGELVFRGGEIKPHGRGKTTWLDKLAAAHAWNAGFSSPDCRRAE